MCTISPGFLHVNLKSGYTMLTPEAIVGMLAMVRLIIADEVKVYNPDDSVFYKKIGILCPSINVEHSHLQTNLLKIRCSFNLCSRIGGSPSLSLLMIPFSTH